MIMKSKSKFVPGWKMTWGQKSEYFRLIDAAAKAVGATTAVAREVLRQQIHEAAFGGPKSAKEINHLKDFDAFKAACLALTQPENLHAQMRQAEMPTTRLIFAIRELAPEAYIIAEVARKRGEDARFRVDDWTLLDEGALTILRNHLAKRAAGIRWPQQQASRKAEAAERDEAGMAIIGGAVCPF
jgi:hypothetical protein